MPYINIRIYPELVIEGLITLANLNNTYTNFSPSKENRAILRRTTIITRVLSIYGIVYLYLALE
jgi:hypothetical protein